MIFYLNLRGKNNEIMYLPNILLQESFILYRQWDMIGFFYFFEILTFIFKI